SPDGEALLLIHHGKLDRWLQPGGHIDPEDASVDAAARREIFEETGVGDLERVGASLVRIDVHEIPERGSEPEHLHLDLGLGFRAASWSIGPIDEVVDAKWVAFDDLESYGVDEALLAGAWSIRSAVN
ncbi:MAG: NUDIX domain-containing protein, partial [Actinomycetota bacterium]